MNTITKLKEVYTAKIFSKIKPIYEKLCDIGIYEFYVAGGAFYSDNDIDIFPTVKSGFNHNELNQVEVVCRTKNAITIKIKDVIVQLCEYYHPNLQSLVKSFDFTHCQIGAKIKQDSDIEYFFHVEEVYMTNDFVVAQATHQTDYVGTEYPLSSLIRIFKYNEQQWFAGRSYIRSALKILKDIIKRGFDGYDDFKNQLDAVDLGFLPEDFKEIDKNWLYDLFMLLNKGDETDD